MLFKLKSGLDEWFAEKNIFDIFFDVCAAAGMGVTCVMANGQHSFLHEFLAVIYYMTSAALIASKRPFKYVYIFFVLVIFLIALFTDGFV